jgi:hypothetical protein
VHQRPADGRVAVDDLGAALDRAEAGDALGADPSARSIAGLQHDGAARVDHRARGGQPGRAPSDHHDVDVHTPAYGGSSVRCYGRS